MTDRKIDVVVVDDHPAVLAGLGHALSSSGTIRIAGQARSSSELWPILNNVRCDVLISDYSMPSGDSVDGTKLLNQVQRKHPDIKIVVLTMLDSSAVVQTLVSDGISGIISKSDSLAHVHAAVHAAHAGGKYYSPTIHTVASSIRSSSRHGQGRAVLSPCEAEVVRLHTQGMKITEIAERLHRSKKTISAQKAKAMEKLGIRREMDLLRYAMESGLISAGGVVAPQAQEAATA